MPHTLVRTLQETYCRGDLPACADENRRRAALLGDDALLHRRDIKVQPHSQARNWHALVQQHGTGRQCLHKQGANGLPPHKDRMALTVLLSLSPPTSFAGGGTGFWRDKANCGPTAVLRPAPGTVLLWGGEVMHAGMPMESITV